MNKYFFLQHSSQLFHYFVWHKQNIVPQPDYLRQTRLVGLLDRFSAPIVGFIHILWGSIDTFGG